MMSRPEELRDRTKAFALGIIRLFRSLPFRTDTQILGKQLLRCGTSVAANYAAVCQARSKVEFIARIGIAAEEADEAVLWIELLTESGNSQAGNDGSPAEGSKGTRGENDRVTTNSEKDGTVAFQLLNF